MTTIRGLVYIEIAGRYSIGDNGRNPIHLLRPAFVLNCITEKYSNSSRGKAARLKYQQSPKGIEARKRYMAKRRAMAKENKQVETVIKEPEVKQEPARVSKEAKS